jgi:uncharacterized protein with GYD domain
MGHYLIQVAYTPEAWGSMVKNPQDRVQAVRPVVESLGGSMKEAFLAFGEYDVITICEFPDNVSSAAFSMAVSAGGACKAIKTTPLMTTTETVDAMTKAGTVGYRPPE